MTKKLYIVRGLPGSGKSTFAEALVGSDFLVCEADKYFMVDGEYKFDATKLKQAHEYCRNLVETYMKDSLVNDQFYREIAVSNTFTQAWEMSPYFELAEKYGYMVFTVIVENRHGGVNQHGVPDDKLEQMKNRFELQLLPVKEIKLEDVFNDEKKEKLKEFINEHKNGK
jgi:adenylate kinase family enzyme